MADPGSPDYKALYLQLLETRRREEESWRQADESWNQEAEGKRPAEQLIRPTSFTELLKHCHVLCRSLSVEVPSRLTGQILLPTEKYCPTRLEYWTDCPSQLSKVYKSVCQYLRPDTGEEPRLFPCLSGLERLGRQFAHRALSSERDFEAYERFGVEEHVHDILDELCKLPAARDEFSLGDGIQFRNHLNILDETRQAEADASELTDDSYPRYDQFCITRVDGSMTTLVTSVEYKPPHRLPVAAFRMGLRPMDLWKEMVRCKKIPTDEKAKLKYNAERLVCSALVQEYHVMIEEGLEYSYLTNGLARILLRVPRDKPSTLYYFFCDPRSEVNPEGNVSSQLWKTSVASVLCLCLMAFSSPIREQEWRNQVSQDLCKWTTSFSHTRSQIPREELQQLHHSDSTSPSHPSPDSGSSYIPSSSPPSSGRPRRQQKARQDQDDQSQRRAAQFCTQRCLLGLQKGYVLDESCPNVDRHRRGQNDATQHPISVEDLIRSLKNQFDENIDRPIPLGGCGSYGAPFKLTCMEYGYTVVGKGTTSGLWNEVSREAQVYQVLRKAQGSAVPVFLGTIDLAKIYFLHGAGQIRHFLVMGWGGECLAKQEMTKQLRREIHKSNKEIKALGIVHDDLRRHNILWNEELGRALIIDFHRSTLSSRPAFLRPGAAKRPLHRSEAENAKRLRVS